ncbi:MAG: inositol monophosphatase [Candidatus Ratteibacteria bacterium]|nr:inositol monophosphatase [Candidatus Ratteibacteria bacterium]
MKDFLKGRDKIGIKAARKSGRILIDNFKKITKISKKSDGTLVTNVDLRMEKEIVKVIRAKFPNDEILSEENVYPVKDSPFCWIIDPLDGTHNYIRGINVVGTSIALAFNKQIVMGIIHMPFAKELYFALQGRGSYLNGKRISVSNRNLKQSTLIYDSNIINEQTETMLKHLKKIKGKVFIMRMFGSTARSLSYIAEGKADLEIEYTDKSWDFAAGAILIEEAGGKFTTHDGRKYDLKATDYIASNGIIHNQVLKIIKNEK